MSGLVAWACSARTPTAASDGHPWLGLAPADLAGGDDPFSMFSGWDSGQLLWLAILVPVAVLVFSVGSRRVRAQLGARSILPRGRSHSTPGDGHRRDASWRAAVDRLESRPPTPIAEARSGLVRIQAVITGATGNLGGAPGRECVWRNRAGAGPSTAVATELLFVADASGRCGIEELEQARVVAPVDKVGSHHESTSLYVGDRIEVIGRFEREVLGEHEDPTRLVYGTLGGDGRLDVHVLERPSPEADAEATPPRPAPAAEAKTASDPEPRDDAKPASDPEPRDDAAPDPDTSFSEIPTRPEHIDLHREANATGEPPAAPAQPDAPEPEP